MRSGGRTGNCQRPHSRLSSLGRLHHHADMIADHTKAFVATSAREVVIESPPALAVEAWRTVFPWMIQGFTTRGPKAAHPFDLGLFSDASVAGQVLKHWEQLREATAQPRIVHARQIHGARVRFHQQGAGGLQLAEPCDGHATATPGIVLCVAAADCVPVYVADPEHEAVAVLHAGWRGAADGVLETGLSVMRARASTDITRVHIHLGPAICGSCYEVGPEVFEALQQPASAEPMPIDLRAVLARRAIAVGVPPGQITVSQHCTRCTESGLFSHRGGNRERQVAYIGIRS